MDCSTPGFPVLHYLLGLFKLMSIVSVMSSNHLILCLPLLLLPSIFPSIRVFSNELVLRIKWPKYWNFSFSVIPSKEIPGLISFRMDWLDLLAVQGTLKNLLQHHSSKASILRLEEWLIQGGHSINISFSFILKKTDKYKNSWNWHYMYSQLNIKYQFFKSFLPCFIILP